jgi:hypothetical protein
LHYLTSRTLRRAFTPHSATMPPLLLFVLLGCLAIVANGLSRATPSERSLLAFPNTWGGRSRVHASARTREVVDSWWGAVAQPTDAKKTDFPDAHNSPYLGPNVKARDSGDSGDSAKRRMQGDGNDRTLAD